MSPVDTGRSTLESGVHRGIVEMEAETMSDTTGQTEDEGLPESLGTVAESMTVAVVTLRPDMRTSDAVAMLRNHGVGGAPVVEAGRLVGIATVSDLVALAPRAQATGPFLRPLRNRPEWCVRDVMSERVCVVTPEEPLVEAVIMMDDREVDRLPVVDGQGRPVGILAREDVVRAVARVGRRVRVSPDQRRPTLLPD
jgi:CBS domain-containing protein